MICKHCNAEIIDGSMTCEKCGAIFEENSTTAVIVPTEAGSVALEDATEKKIRKSALINSIIGLVFGILFYVPLTSFVGILFSIISLFKVRKYHKKYTAPNGAVTASKWMGISGLILNILGIITNVVYLVITIIVGIGAFIIGVISLVGFIIEAIVTIILLPFIIVAAVIVELVTLIVPVLTAIAPVLGTIGTVIVSLAEILAVVGELASFMQSFA